MVLAENSSVFSDNSSSKFLILQLNLLVNCRAGPIEWFPKIISSFFFLISYDVFGIDEMLFLDLYLWAMCLLLTLRDLRNRT